MSLVQSGLTNGLVSELVSPLVRFTPASTRGLSLWLDAADTSTITEIGGDVSQWDDKSGNGNHAVQGNSALQPGYSTDATGGYMQFNGGDLPPAGTTDYFELTSVAPNKTVFFVSDWAGKDFSWVFGTAIADSHIFQHATGYGMSIDGGSADSGEWFVNGVSQGSGGNIGTPTATNVPLIHTVKFDPGDPTAEFSRIAAYTDNQGGYDGKIREVLMFDRYLSTSEINQIVEYLSLKWGI